MGSVKATQLRFIGQQTCTGTSGAAEIVHELPFEPAYGGFGRAQLGSFSATQLKATQAKVPENPRQHHTLLSVECRLVDALIGLQQPRIFMLRPLPAAEQTMAGTHGIGPILALVSEGDQ